MASDWETAPVDKLTHVSTAPNGALAIGLLLKDGRLLALDFDSEERGKLIDGLVRTKMTLSGGMAAGYAATVTDIDVQNDALGQVVIVMPRAGDVQLDRLAIPPDLAEKLVEAITAKLGELTRSNRDLRSKPS
jgi:hypothetical protein